MRKEKEIVQHLKNNSYQAFDILYEKYERLLYGFVFNLTHSHEITKELVQDTFIKVWLNRDKIDENLSFKAWLFKIAQNQLIDRIRKLWKEPLWEDYLELIKEKEPQIENDHLSLDFDVFRDALNKSKQKLSPRQKEVFELCKEEGISSSEVAILLSISEQAVYNYLSQAIKILRKELSSYHLLFTIFFF